MPTGTFILRFSSSVPNAVALSFREERGVRQHVKHILFYRTETGNYRQATKQELKTGRRVHTGPRASFYGDDPHSVVSGATSVPSIPEHSMPAHGLGSRQSSQHGLNNNVNNNNNTQHSHHQRYKSNNSPSSQSQNNREYSLSNNNNNHSPSGVGGGGQNNRNRNGSISFSGRNRIGSISYSESTTSVGVGGRMSVDSSAKVAKNQNKRGHSRKKSRTFDVPQPLGLIIKNYTKLKYIYNKHKSQPKHKLF